MTVKSQDQESKDLRAQHPNAWIAIDEGDKIEGVVTEITRAWSDAKAQGGGDGWYPLLRVQTADNTTLDVHGFSTVLYNAIMEKKPRPGERVVITYRGEGKKKEGRNAPKLFSVTVPDRDPREAADDVYGSLAGDASGRRSPTAQTAQTAPSDEGDLPF